MQKHYGIKKEELEEIDEIDIDKEIEEKDKDKKDKIGDNKEKEDKNKKLTTDETRKLDIREETSANKSIKGQTLRDKLGLEEEGITDVEKIARVSTSSIEGEKISNQLDTFVAIKTNEEAVVLRRKHIKVG